MPYIGLKLSLEAFEALRKCSKERNISYLYSEPPKMPIKIRGPRSPSTIIIAVGLFRRLRVKIRRNFYWRPVKFAPIWKVKIQTQPYSNQNSKFELLKNILIWFPRLGPFSAELGAVSWDFECIERGRLLCLNPGNKNLHSNTPRGLILYILTSYGCMMVKYVFTWN